MFKSLWLIAILFLSPAFQIQKRTCDHPAPPEGMHYICNPQNACDCRLERDSQEAQEDSTAPATPPAASPAEPCSAEKVKYFVVPPYPAEARKARKQGTVTVQLTVDRPGAAIVEIEAGAPVFAEPVRMALKKWRFAPSAESQTLTATFTFAIAGNPTEHMSTTVSGSSPLNLVIAATPPVR